MNYIENKKLLLLEKQTKIHYTENKTRQISCRKYNNTSNINKHSFKCHKYSAVIPINVTDSVQCCYTNNLNMQQVISYFSFECWQTTTC